MRIAITLAFLATSGATVGAQTAQPAAWLPPDSAAWEQISPRIAGRQRVRVVWQAVPIEVTGPAVTVEGVRPPYGDSLLAWSDISRVQVRGSAFTKGLKIGAIAGGALGLVTGLSSLGECQGWMDFFCDADAGDVVVLTFVGALAYGFLGGLIAAPFGMWTTVYQARPAMLPPARVTLGLGRDPGGKPMLQVGARLRL